MVGWHDADFLCTGIGLIPFHHFNYLIGLDAGGGEVHLVSRSDVGLPVRARKCQRHLAGSHTQNTAVEICAAPVLLNHDGKNITACLQSAGRNADGAVVVEVVGPAILAVNGDTIEVNLIIVVVIGVEPVGADAGVVVEIELTAYEEYIVGSVPLRIIRCAGVGRGSGEELGLPSRSRRNLPCTNWQGQ